MFSGGLGIGVVVMIVCVHVDDIAVAEESLRRVIF